MRHPFEGRAGKAQRLTFAKQLFAAQHGKCRMCGKGLDPALSGKDGDHVDHIRPYRLRPDLGYTLSNLQLVCNSCHNGPCASIEAKHWPNGWRIELEKFTHKPIAVSGWRE